MRKGACGEAAPCTPRGFNGAATFRLRKVFSQAISAVPPPALQWGRNLSVAEGPGHTRQWMRPNGLQWGRNLSVAEGHGHLYCRRAVTRRFNGAATFRLRKEQGHRAAASPSGASMGPQPFGCGRRLSTSCSAFSSLLQWGRNLSVAEGVWGEGTLRDRRQGFNGAQ